jgi:hypothetical protein
MLGSTVIVINRLLALALGLLLVGGNGAVCEGLVPTPEARMACCAESADCPMHQGGSRHAGSGRTLTQAQADACCTASKHDQSNRSNSTFVAAISSAVLGSGVVVPAVVPPLVLSDGWKTATPVPIAPVPRHVLLSVFLV